MDDKKFFLVSAFALMIVLAGIVFVLLNNNQGAEPTGLVLIDDTKTALLQKDVIEISSDEIIKCCSFINDKGEEEGCYVLSRYSCDFCSDYCE